eukprot:1956450-Pleurochrysis_carterae.AAC.2
MSHNGAGVGATSARRVGKSSDPDHPFHPCAHVDSDDAAIEATRPPETLGAKSSTTTLRIRTAIRSRHMFRSTRSVHPSLSLLSALTV